MSYILIGGSIISIIVIVIILYFLFAYMSNKQIEEINKMKESLEQQTTTECPAPQTIMGKQGLQGPPGKNGGVFLKQGPMRNLKYNNLIMDRLAGYGDSSVAYLDNMNYSTHQTWTLDAESQYLKNEFGGCLYGDTEKNKAYIMDCDNTPPKGLKWVYDNNGRMKLQDTELCLVPIYQGIMKDVQQNESLNLGDKVINPYDKFIQVKLDKCNNSNEQQWSFY